MNIANMKDELHRIRVAEKETVKDPKVKALCVIDMLTCNDDFGDHKLLSTIYRVAHSASGICGNEHQDWQKETQMLYRKLKKVT